MAGDSKSVKSGVSTGIRVGIAAGVALILALFIGFFELQYSGVATRSFYLIGYRVLLPFLSVLLSFGGNCLIQYLSCNQIEWLLQFGRSFIILIPLLVAQFILYFNKMRWPIEGMMQLQPPQFQKAMSTSFYIFWAALYGQASVNSLSQMCPK